MPQVLIVLFILLFLIFLLLVLILILLFGRLAPTKSDSTQSAPFATLCA